jgi:magnesium transporter
MAFFTKRYHPPGTAPGTLRHEVAPAGAPPLVRLVCYDSDGVEFATSHGDLPAKTPAMAARQRIWLHVQGRATQPLLHALGERYGLHTLALEDIHNTGQRPKAEEFDGQLFAVLALPRYTQGRVEFAQVSVVFAAGFVLSFCEGGLDPFEPVLRRLREDNGRLRRQQADYLLYALVDAVIDQGFPTLEAFGLALEDLEEELLAQPGPETLSRIHAVKRELILMRRMLWPHREVVKALTHDDLALVGDATRVFLRDCADHAVQVMDLVETYRDMSTSMLDIYLSSVSNRMNDIMRVLTVIATIFIPLTFIVGVYGMNFVNNGDNPWAMPELYLYYGYPVVWLVMIAVAAGMLAYFRRKGWL